VEEEADESLFWMELLILGKLMREQQLKELSAEAKELLAITIASIRTVKKKK
jgi:hypothetical protein